MDLQGRFSATTRVRICDDFIPISPRRSLGREPQRWKRALCTALFGNGEVAVASDGIPYSSPGLRHIAKESNNKKCNKSSYLGDQAWKEEDLGFLAIPSLSVESDHEKGWRSWEG